MANEYNIKPSEMAATWAPNDVHEAFYFLRLRYLLEAPGGA